MNQNVYLKQNSVNGRFKEVIQPVLSSLYHLDEPILHSCTSRRGQKSNSKMVPMAAILYVMMLLFAQIFIYHMTWCQPNL